MKLKSTKYELLKADYDLVRKELKLYREIIEQQRKEMEELKQEKKYWIDSHNNHKKAVDALREIAIYEGDFYGNDMAIIAKRALSGLL